ncbi:MAG: hypothetical protein ACEY3F_03665 [Wolbachia sp.]
MSKGSMFLQPLQIVGTANSRMFYWFLGGKASQLFREYECICKEKMFKLAQQHSFMPSSSP